MTLLDFVPRTCEKCGGTILAPTIGGVPRGTCHCPANRLTDWGGEAVRITRPEPIKRGPPAECCLQLIESYESIDRVSAEVAKARGGVALFCPTCKGRVTYSDNKWQREV